MWKDSVTMPEKPHIPFVPPTFSWDSPNLYSQCKIFKQKVDFAFKGTFRESAAAEKVCTILNWLGDNAYEIYEHLHWEANGDKDDPDKVLKAFELFQARTEPVPFLVHSRKHLQWSIQVST